MVPMLATARTQTRETAYSDPLGNGGYFPSCQFFVLCEMQLTASASVHSRQAVQVRASGWVFTEGPRVSGDKDLRARYCEGSLEDHG